MYKSIFKTVFCVGLVLFAFSCSDSDEREEEYEEIPVYPTIDFAALPYATLSEYTFFKNDLKDLSPAVGVLPYDLNSGLFTDYASKKRFVWMPEGVSANYAGDEQILDFPVGTILIKNFYYDDTYPDHGKQIVETRLMIRNENEWTFVSYLWNDDQTEAYLNDNIVSEHVVFYESGEVIDFNYQVPSPAQCIACHRNGGTPTPIGPKPQNLFKNFQYADGSANQLVKWAQQGYLQNAPSSVHATVDWTDTSKSLDLRARSYLDINCAHCHSTGGPCDYTPMNLAFSQTSDPLNYGLCVPPQDFLSGDQPYIIAGQNVSWSMLPYRMSSNEQSEMMPTVGRTMVHTQGLQLMQDWINSMQQSCP